MDDGAKWEAAGAALGGNREADSGIEAEGQEEGCIR